MDLYSDEGPGDMAQAFFRSSQEDGCFDDYEIETGCTPAELAAETLTGDDLLYADDVRMPVVVAQIATEEGLAADLARRLDAILGHAGRAHGTEPSSRSGRLEHARR